MRNYSIHNMKWENRGHELDGLASIMLGQAKRYYLIGSREEVAFFYEKTGRYMGRDIPVVMPQEGQLGWTGQTTVSEKDLCMNDRTILICAVRNRAEYEAQRKKWREKGFVENRSFFQGELFSMIYDVYVRNQIRIDRIEIFLTSRCTLNCEKCISYIPYFTRRVDIPLEQLKKDADILFRKVD